MESVYDRLAGISLRFRTPSRLADEESCSTPRIIRKNVVDVELDIEPPRPKTARTTYKHRDTKQTSLNREQKQKEHFKIQFDSPLEQRELKPRKVPLSSRTTKSKSVLLEEKCPDKKDIMRLRKQTEQTRSRSIYWGDGSDFIPGQRIDTDYSSLPSKPKPKRIISDISEPVDINAPPAAAPLISTKALVADFIGVPNSLTFIQ